MWSFKQLLLAVIYSYALITIINYLVHWAWPAVPIAKTGVALLIFFVGIIIAAIAVLTSDGSFDSSDIKGLLTIVAILVALYFGIRFALPDLFSVINNFSGGAFSIFG